ncbi:hypothetical protein LCGC14_1671820, partial [marine sediment metagenome]
MIKEIIGRVVEGENLSIEESRVVMNEIMEGEATDVQIASFITALRMKGETVNEIAGCASVMREKATHIDVGDDIVVDTCGTGGDAKCTFNISTAAAFVVAGAGLKVAKHGNTASSSHCGSADVLKVLGVNARDGVWGTRNRPDVVEGVAARAEAIARTEMTRINNLAQFSTQEQAGNLIPGLLKRWIATARGNTRDTHISAHRRYFNNPI